MEDREGERRTACVSRWRPRSRGGNYQDRGPATRRVQHEFRKLIGIYVFGDTGGTGRKSEPKGGLGLRRGFTLLRNSTIPAATIYINRSRDAATRFAAAWQPSNETNCRIDRGSGAEFLWERLFSAGISHLTLWSFIFGTKRWFELSLFLIIIINVVKLLKLLLLMK